MRIERKIFLTFSYIVSCIVALMTLQLLDKPPLFVYIFALVFCLGMLSYGVKNFLELKTYGFLSKNIFTISSAICAIFVVVFLLSAMWDAVSGPISKNYVVADFFESSYIMGKSANDGMREVILKDSDGTEIKKSFYLPKSTFENMFSDKVQFITQVQKGDEVTFKFYKHTGIYVSLQYKGSTLPNKIGISDMFVLLCFFLMFCIVFAMKSDDIETIRQIQRYEKFYK